MSAYEFGYIVGFATIFLLVCWLALKVVKPKTLAGLNLTVGMTAVLLVAGQFSHPAASKFLGCLASVGFAYYLLYRAHAKRITHTSDDVATLRSTGPAPGAQLPPVGTGAVLGPSQPESISTDPPSPTD
jgi:hypothetical protein